MIPNPKDFRIDAADKLCGKTNYIRDEKIDGLWYGGTIRCPYARARVKKIVFDSEFNWETVTVVTAKDIPNNYVSMLENDMVFLVDEIANYAGEPVVVIAAADTATLEQAKKHVQIEYEELPAIFDMLESEVSEIKIFGEKNIFKEILIENGDLEIAKQNAEHKIEIEVRTGFQEQAYLEPQGIVAIPEQDRIVIRGSMQCPYYVKGALDTMFDNKKHITVIHVPSFHKDTAYVDNKGKILGLDLNLILDGGAYCTLSQVVLARAALTATGCYFVPNIRILAKAVATNTVPNGAFRGFGGPQAVFAIEMLMEKIAHELGLNPKDVREINMIEQGQQTPTGQKINLKNTKNRTGKFWSG
ncbi:hypothetical protein B6I21_07050 [candidate division KSB1 bacterium 4572_119]|nr:MAG: hypothetical protein B6I21_07050 [candidate division KSB1 bacterium 4572_119]